MKVFIPEVVEATEENEAKDDETGDAEVNPSNHALGAIVGRQGDKLRSKRVVWMSPTKGKRNAGVEDGAGGGAGQSDLKMADVTGRSDLQDSMLSAVKRLAKQVQSNGTAAGEEQQGVPPKTHYYINKPPRWNDQVGAYVLNFNGRVTMASIKNFQLVDPEEQDVVILQCGRIGKNEFTMDLQWPMTPLQAFAISMSSLDSKIA